MKIAQDAYPIPNTINVCGLFASLAVATTLLVLASRAYEASLWLTFAVCVVLFSYCNNTNFSFLHESVHGILHSHRTVNDSLGCVAATCFPTSFTLQQYFHLGHHCRNRTDAEMFDLYYPHDNIWLKRLVIYAMPSGLYWLSAVAANFGFLFCPWLLKAKALRDSAVMQYSSFDFMLGGVPESRRIAWRIRRQIVLTIAIQAGLIYFGGIAWPAWLACYWLFGMNWGSLQYTDHAFSKRDIRNGAWNLRVDPVTRFIFLNYHYHLAHHQYPNVPWLYLPRLVTPDEERPWFWSNFFKLLSGPYPATEPSPESSRELRHVVYQGTSMAEPADTARP